MAKRIFVSLTGGLGNQLFQLASGIANSSDRVELVSYLGNPRLSMSGNPDLFSYELPPCVSIAKKKKVDFFSNKLVRLLLRLSSKTVMKDSDTFLKKCTILFSTLILSFKIGARIAIKVSNGLGFSKLVIPPRDTLLVGYFQSYRWASETQVLIALKKLKLVIESPEVSRYMNLADREKPLAVHVRLGDYKNEPTIGVLSKEYYEKAIENILSEGQYGAIWLFSDELELAGEIIAKCSALPVRMIPTVNESAAATLEVMRFCKGYVIANSTFSWWGAFLSYTPNASVIVPKPWFKGIKDPRDLIPPHWMIQDT